MAQFSTSGAEGEVDAWIRKAVEDEEAARILQDIEFAMEKTPGEARGKLFIVQSRPMTTL